MSASIVASVSSDAQVPSGPSLSHLWTIGRAAKYCHCHPSSLRRHIAAGRLPVIRLPGGWFRIDKNNLDILYNLAVEKEVKQNIRKPLIYCRVSSQEQKRQGNLDRQLERCVDYCRETYGCAEPHIYTECQGAWNAREIMYKAWDCIASVETGKFWALS